MENASRPELSVVITVVEGDPALSRCLEALRRQTDRPTMEIIVPYDDTVSEIRGLTPRFPEVRFLPLGSLGPESSTRNAFTEHALYDRRRAAGLRETRGKLVAMLEDRGEPQPHWARAMVALHGNSPCAVIGGAIENGAQGPIRWAIFFCDFGRFQPPVERRDPEYISDINICYKREALESVRPLWVDRYQEATVNWELRRRGLPSLLSDRALVVQERKTMSPWAVVKERAHWGRMFGLVRGREVSAVRCILLALATPLLPVVLSIRHFRRQLGKRKNMREFLFAFPAMLVLLHFWALGEFIGYCESATQGRRH
jgi:hypothetical protein